MYVVIVLKVPVNFPFAKSILTHFAFDWDFRELGETCITQWAKSPKKQSVGVYGTLF